ncbi:dynein regulatory complex protein 11 isoform X2 [Neocloeon triangulifer]|uniref:dynein regulatory complex protein 11 isoform X2 n=1 Tax=Neocloeon triangulifer TaxID=2078957 RepID=UPI00286EE787|nr:dynein regulatory complex protein 11 isoform X2 [Neocloeon triangulifer]
MSHQYYQKVWAEAVNVLNTASSLDAILQSAKPERDKKLSHTIVSGLYAKYALVLKKLDACFDQTVQPQKRIMIRKLLDATIGRLIEVKHEMVNLDLSEFSNMGGAIAELQVLPSDVEEVVPKYYKAQRMREITERKAHLNSILKKLGIFDEKHKALVLTEDEAIRLIQTHERARQGRLRAKLMRELTLIKNKMRPAAATNEKIKTAEEAALVLQKTWRGLQSRRATKSKKIAEMILIGMQQPVVVEERQRRRALEVEEMRRQMQVVYRERFQKAMVEERLRVEQLQTLKLTRQIASEVRNWFMDYKNGTGKFPELPTEEMGGSAILFGGGGDLEQGVAESEASKSTVASTKEGKSKKDKGKKAKEKESKKAKDAMDDDPGFKMQPSNFLPSILSGNTEFDEIWRGKNEVDNPLQHHYMDMIENEKQQEVEREVRRVVDEALRVELELLKAALDRDRANRGKKVKKGGKKKGRKGGKKGKKKREKDLTPDRTTDSLFEELVTQGIIRYYPDTPLSNFFGDCALAMHEQKKQGKEPSPGLGDVRRLINEYCILPLGSKEIHQASPLVRSVLLTGPTGSGKDLIVQTVCSELGAVLFDLTPTNLAGNYPGKAGLTMLVHLINKVSRLVQPSVLYMDMAEKPFMKKVPKQDKSDPKRLKKDLPKIVKGIGPDDQIILIGCSNNPWECDQKALTQTFNKIIVLPKPDYGSLSAMWRHRLMQFPAVSRQFNTGVMAKLCDGYAMGTVVKVINEVMTCKRVLQLKTQPLTHAEFINCLAKYDPIFREEEECYSQWYAKTPLGKKKIRALELEEEMKAEKEKRKKKK